MLNSIRNQRDITRRLQQPHHESTKKYGTDYGVKLIAMAEYYSRSINSALPGDNFVMDSGAGCHVDPDTIVTDPDNKTRLTGFLGEATWTKGRGHIPLRIHDDLTGHTVDIDINNADNVPNSRVSLLSCLLYTSPRPRDGT